MMLFGEYYFSTSQLYSHILHTSNEKGNQCHIISAVSCSVHFHVGLIFCILGNFALTFIEIQWLNKTDKHITKVGVEVCVIIL